MENIIAMNIKFLPLFLFLFLSQVLISQENNPEPGTELENILKNIQDGLQVAANALDEDELPPLKSVELTLQGYHYKKTGGKLKFFIISFGKERISELTQTVVITLTPPKSGPENVSSNSITKKLADIIIAAAEGVNAAGISSSGSNVPLNFTKLSAELVFVVTKDKNGGLAFTFEPFSLDVEAGKGVKKSELQKIKIVYEAK